jgi:GNAT superfamily N-acetyltransferase
MQKTLELEQNKIHFKHITIEAIKDLASFYCLNPSIDEFLKTEAYICHVMREASTTLVYYEDTLVGYYTLTRNPLKDIQPDLVKEEHLYALELARLAVSKDFQGKGIGTYIMNHIIDIAYRVNDRFITTDALFERWEWYKSLGFDYLLEEEINPDTCSGLVYMLMDLYDPQILKDYFDE